MRRTCKLQSFHLACFAVVVCLAVLSTWNTFSNAFVAGDVQFVQDNPAIKSSSVIVTAFTRGYWFVGGTSAFGGTYYRPLVVLLDAWDYFLWGDKPFGFHLTNTILHAGVSALVFVAMAHYFRSRFTALAGGLLFAVHPLHVHAIAYISARSALLCTGFYVAAVWSTLRYARDVDTNTSRTRDLALALAFYVGGLLSLEATITLPVVLGAVLFFTPNVFSKNRKQVLVFLGALVALSFGYFVIRRFALGTFVSIKEALVQALPPIPALLSVAKIYAFYFVKLVVPTDVTYLPPFSPALSASDVGGLLSAILVVALGAFVIAGPKSFRTERLAITWIFLTLMPVSGFVPLDHFVKGQYAYLPSVGACALYGSLARRAWSHAAKQSSARAIRIGIAGIYGITLFSYTGLTMLENMYWKSSTTLFARIFEFDEEMPDELLREHVMRPTVARLAAIHYLYGAAKSQEGDCDEALPHFLRAEKLAPHKKVRLEARFGEADCLFKQKDFPGALEVYSQLVEEDPSDKLAPARAAVLWLQMGKPAKAAPFLDKACQRGVKEACADLKRLSP